jgi:hypothetical protein
MHAKAFAAAIRRIGECRLDVALDPGEEKCAVARFVFKQLDVASGRL